MARITSKVSDGLSKKAIHPVDTSLRDIDWAHSVIARNEVQPSDEAI